jgi:Na+-driven multidrug efflux pump
MSAVLFFRSLSMGCAVIIVSVGWQKFRLIPQIASAFSNIFLNLWAIPRWGVLGAAWAYVISDIVLFIGYASISSVFFLNKSKLAKKKYN